MVGVWDELEVAVGVAMIKDALCTHVWNSQRRNTKITVKSPRAIKRNKTLTECLWRSCLHLPWTQTTLFVCYNFKLHCFVGHGMIILIFDSTFHQPLNSSFHQCDIEGEERMAGEILALQPQGKLKHHIALQDCAVEWSWYPGQGIAHKVQRLPHRSVLSLNLGWF